MKRLALLCLAALLFSNASCNCDETEPTHTWSAWCQNVGDLVCDYKNEKVLECTYDSFLCNYTDDVVADCAASGKVCISGHCITP
jgi:hypothetical protein